MKIIILALLLTGCAATSEVANIQTQIDQITIEVKDVQHIANDAKISALQARHYANGAERWSLLTEQYTQETAAKLDSLLIYIGK